MTWELGPQKDFSKLLEYECHLEELLNSRPKLGGICQYHRETLPVEAVEAAILAHQTVYFNETLVRLNPFYCSPCVLANEGPPKTHLYLLRMLSHLRQGQANSQD